MTKKYAMLHDLRRCTGCWTCAIACKVAHDLPLDEFRKHIRTLGDGTGIDEPAGIWPNLSMSWMPISTSSCTFCGERVAEGLEPHCVYNCSTKAITFGDVNDSESPISKRLATLKEKGYRIFQLPSWENTKPGVIYAEYPKVK